ncbi:hypothetical protein BGX34_000501, partial [Mortierella sp. NVP85]
LVEGQVPCNQSTHQEKQNTNLQLTSEPSPSSFHGVAIDRITSTWRQPNWMTVKPLLADGFALLKMHIGYPPIVQSAVPAKSNYIRKDAGRQDRGAICKGKRIRNRLSPEMKFEIKTYKAMNPEKSFREVGEKFNASKTTVHRIIHGKRPCT